MKNMVASQYFIHTVSVKITFRLSMKIKKTDKIKGITGIE